MRRCWFCVFETPSWIISLVPSIDVLAVYIRIQAPDEASADLAGLSLDLLRPSPVSCNREKTKMSGDEQRDCFSYLWNHVYKRHLCRQTIAPFLLKEHKQKLSFETMFHQYLTFASSTRDKRRARTHSKSSHKSSCDNG